MFRPCSMQKHCRLVLSLVCSISSCDGEKDVLLGKPSNRQIVHHIPFILEATFPSIGVILCA